MKAPWRPHQREDEDLAMTSMIDVVFLLLVFFVWTSSFDLPETSLPGRIAMAAEPKQDTPNAQPDAVTKDRTEIAEVQPTEIIVRVLATSEGTTYRVGAIGLSSIDAVASKLAAIAELPVESLVIIDPDPSITVNETIAVFDLARRMRFSRVLLAVE